MMNVPRMLLIGSTGRDSGKTLLACALIRKWSAKHNIVGVKVTAIHARDGQCPRGGEGCGVCSSLSGNFCITEEGANQEIGVPGEHTGGSEKDTQRLLAAGARRVYWLRVLKQHLDEGVAALLDTIGGGAWIVCESNSVRMAVEPGVFLMCRSRDGKTAKPSAASVARYADRIVLFDGDGFDLDVDDVDIVDNGWALRYDAAAIIMAGGSSERMRRDKSLMLINGRPMVGHIAAQLEPHFKQILISANDAAKYAFLGAEVVPDRVPGQGPLMGLASALGVSRYDRNFVMACDIPEVRVSVVRRMLRAVQDHDAAVPRVQGIHIEPLFAVYRKTILGVIEAALAAGVFKVRDVINGANVEYIDLADAEPIVNLNSPEDYERFVTNISGKKIGASHDPV